MQSSMQKYKKRMLTLSIMLLVIVLLSGVSYAIFTNYASQTDANTLAASCMDLDFNGQNEINLTNTYPVKDGEALEQTPYTFTIKNKCDNYIEYYVIASVINTSNILDSKYVKVSLLGDSDLTSSPINNLETIATPQSLSGYNIINNYILKKGDGISKNESRTFNYRMWVNGDLQDSWTSEDVESKNYQVKISVVGTVKTKPKDDLFIATTIDGTASSTFPETKNYSASVSCTQDNKTVDIGAAVNWTGSKWSLSVSNLTSGNTKCTISFETKNTINFNIGGSAYTAIIGMTWEEWINSEYNPDNKFVINNNWVYVNSDTLNQWVAPAPDARYLIEKTTLIIENENYVITSGAPDKTAWGLNNVYI